MRGIAIVAPKKRNKVQAMGLGLIAMGVVAALPAWSVPGPAAGNPPAIVEPKALTANVSRGLAYLVGLQQADGGWSEGEESAYMRASGKHNQEKSNVADTCMAALAVVRAGHFPDSGKYAANVEKAVAFVCASIERSDDRSLSVTDITGTRVQAKLGPHVDTFLAPLFLSEVKGRMPNAAGNKRLDAALAKVVGKIERNQADDGQWGGGGWAPVHSQALATKGLNRARQVGALVDDRVLRRAEAHAKRSYDKNSGFDKSGSAGVGLYAAGAAVGSLQESINTNEMRKDDLRKIAMSASLPKEERDRAQEELTRFADADQVQAQALKSVVGQLGDKQFVSGFGCNGGEEFLSYLHISETLLANHSQDWADWDRKITDNIVHVQNSDGSWMGQHCITSRTFCTAAALMVLMADRAPINRAVSGARKGASM